jgi:hypothetical protein
MRADAFKLWVIIVPDPFVADARVRAVWWPIAHPPARADLSAVLETAG